MMDKDIRHPTDQCIKCTICVEHCPVVRVTDKFLGPKQVGPDFQRFRSDSDNPHDASVEYCIGCRLCDVVCPSGVNISELNNRARLALREKNGISIRDRILSHTYMLGPMASLIAPLTNRLLNFRPLRWFADRLLDIEKKIEYPDYSPMTFEKWTKTYQFKSDKKVAYFYGCFTNYNYPTLGETVVKVLELNGYQVVFPKQNCCGLPLLGNGDVRGARKLARKNLKGLLKAVDNGLDIIYSSTSCGMMIRDDYVTYLDILKAQGLIDNMIEISEFLYRLYERGELNTDFIDMDMVVPYHIPCHLRSLGIGFPAIDLMEIVPGIDLVELGTYCCGLAGTYGFKSEKFEISMAIGEELASRLKDYDSPYAASDCEACRMQIEGLSDKKAIHPVQLLAMAYGIDIEVEGQ